MSFYVKNIYGEPLLPCRKGFDTKGSWDKIFVFVLKHVVVFIKYVLMLETIRNFSN